MNSLENSVKRSNEMQIWKRNAEKWEVDKVLITNERLTFLKIALPHQIESLGFAEKVLYFRLQLDKLRIPWIKGSDMILIRRDNIIKDSLNFINVCNMQKEIKIYFEAENVQDAGGLLREWIYLVSKELAQNDNGKFL
jgi:E3 ubiquitin-protein ligase HUWE1